MTPRYRLPGILAVLFVLGAASPASAQEGFFWWLERLSGPGPYHGFGASFTPICIGAEKKTRIEDDPSRQVNLDLSPFFDPGCGRASRNHLRAMLRFEIARLGAGGNNLQYATPRSADELETSAFVFVPAIDVGVSSWLEVGAGIGLVRFSGDLFDSFTKAAIQPVRITIKPLLLSRRETRRYELEFLQLRYTASVIPGGFEAEDFGAVPGTFSTGTEFLSSVSIVIDALSLFELLRR